MRHVREGRYVLNPYQQAAVDGIANHLSETQRHSFLLRVGKTLMVSANRSDHSVTDALLLRAVAKSLEEVAA